MAAPGGELRVWIGIFDVSMPEVPTLSVEGGHGNVSILVPLAPIRDFAQDDKNRALNHRCVFKITGLTAATEYTILIGSITPVPLLKTRTLPNTLPQKMDGSLNILLCSCYSQPEDDAGLVSTIASQIMRRTDLTLMMGDQIYGDLPLFEDLPDEDAGVADKINRKYRRNFIESQLGIGGLGSVLARAPVVCVADDHEYWNNYPFRQVQLPKTWTSEGREQWRTIAHDLYEDYQLDGPAGGAKRIDIAPISILVVDMRSLRDEKFGLLLNPTALQQLSDWAKDLKAQRAGGHPAFGMLVSGQAMMVEPASESKRVSADAEMRNYSQFSEVILPTLEDLSADGIPVLYVTGDVHWSRVARARDVTSNQTMLYEVIVSPSCLIRIPGVDSAKEALNGLKGIFGSEEPWPRHDMAPPLPKKLRENGRFSPYSGADTSDPFSLKGDCIAVLSISRAGGGLEFQVTYYGISRDKALAKSVQTPIYQMRNF
jgi:hypothetical protein